jgi:hypothetical protein
MTRRILLILSLVSILIISSISGPGCANIIPPAGGPKDSLPPQLRRAEPADSTLNFRSTRFSFSFDEYVEVQNIQQELLVSPVPRNAPAVDYRLNTVSVRLKDTLEPNTTYTIDFGNSIKDINEGNVLRNFTYTFSTGPYIDSLEFSGNVILAETGRIDTTLIVMLHSNPDDSAVVREKPRYVSKLDSKGRFVFKNLPPRTYRVYALKDETNTRRYFDDKQLFAFADSPVVISDTTRSVTLYAYSNRPPAVPAVTTAAPPTRTRGATQTTDRRLKFSTNLIGTQQDLLGRFIMIFEQPLRAFDSTLVSLKTDTTFTPVADARIFKDSTNRQMTVTTAWKENTTYHLIMDQNFAEDSAGRKLPRTDTLTFTTKRISDYGKLRLRIRNLDLTRNPVLQFVLNGNITQSFPLSSVDFAQQMFFPGDYELRILYDNNKNGKWDPGNFFGQRRQPELVQPIDRKIIIKPNWENEFEIAL